MVSDWVFLLLLLSSLCHLLEKPSVRDDWLILISGCKIKDLRMRSTTDLECTKTEMYTLRMPTIISTKLTKVPR